MAYVTVGQENSINIDLYYEDLGTGRPVLLIHGWPLSGTSWEKQTAALLAAGYRVITYDRRGFGRSSRPSTGYDYDTFASDLQKLLAKLDLRDCAIAGFSMGGGEVARYLGRYGAEQRVSRAIFIASVPPMLLKTADNPEGLDGSVFDGVRRALIADRPAFLMAFLKNFYNADVLGGKSVSDEVIQANWNVAVEASPKGTLDCVSQWGADFRNDLSRITVPTLVIHGSADRIVPVAASAVRTARAVKGARLVILENGPHGLTWTHADDVNRELLEFLGEHSAAEMVQ